jgi:hypothetical protein
MTQNIDIFDSSGFSVLPKVRIALNRGIGSSFGLLVLLLLFVIPAKAGTLSRHCGIQ